MTSDEITEWLSVSQAAKLVGVVPSSIIWAIANERLHAVKTARGLLVDPESAEAYRQQSHRTWRQKREKATVTDA